MELIKTIKYFFKKAFVLNFASAVKMLVFFFFNIFLIKTLDMKEYGIYKYFMTFIPFVRVFSFPSYGVAARRDVARNKYGLYWVAFKKRMLFSLISILFLLVLGLYYYFSGNTLITYLSLITAVFFIPWHTYDYFKSFFLGRGEFKKISILGMGADVLFLLVFLILINVSSHTGVIEIFLMQALIYSIFNIYIFYLVLKMFPKENKEKGDSLKVGKKLGLSNIILIGASNVDNLILKFFVPFSEIAIYSGAVVFVSVFKAMNKNFNVSFFPVFANKKTVSEAFYLIKKRLLISHIITFVFGIFFYYTLPYLGELILPEKYALSVNYAAILIFFVVVFEFQSQTLKNILESQAKINSRFWALISLSVIRVTTMLICSALGGVSLLVKGKAVLYFFSLLVWYIMIYIEIKKEKKETILNCG